MPHGPEHSGPTAACNPAPSPKGGGAEDDWQALAGELAEAAAFFREKTEHYQETLKGTEYGYIAARGAIPASRHRATLAR